MTRPADTSPRWPPELLLILALAMAPVLASPLSTDAGYMLVAARRVLGGERLYVDLLETNPPSIVWLMQIPAAAGRYLGISDALLVAGFVAVVLAVSGLLAIRTSALDPTPSRLARFTAIAGFVAGIVIPSTGQMGQRDQLAAMLLLPYVFLAARAAAGRTSPPALAIACGVLAGIGVALKPFFLAPWVAAELTVALTRRRAGAVLRAETLVVVAVQVLHAILIVTLTPEYVSRIVPIAAATYGAYDYDRTLLVSSNRVLGLAAAAVLALFAPVVFGRSGTVAVGRILGASVLGWLVSYVWQGKGWYYHLVPAMAFASAALAASVVETAAGWRRPGSAARRSHVGLAAVVIVSLASGIWMALAVARVASAAVRDLRQPYPPIVEAMTSRVERLAAAGEPVYMLSTDLFPAFPVVNLTGVSWPYRYHFLWPLPGLYPGDPGSVIEYRAPPVQSALERAFFDTVVADLQAHPPRLLIVDRVRNQFGMNGRRFDFITYFSASTAFATLLSGYDEIEGIGEYDFYVRRR